MVRTIESLLGIAPNSLFSAAAAPMTEVFDLTQSSWNYKAKNSHTASYWQKKLGDMDYDEEDRLDTPRFNRELWIGMMGRRKPYPQVRSGKNLRENRITLLRQFGILDN